MVSKVRSYLLPEGEAFTDEIACCLVYYPDKKEYRQALVSSLLYLGNWLAWERDAEKRGKDAAASWLIANELTLECMYMGCLDQLQADVAEILLYLKNTVPCCGDNTTYGDSTVYITTIIPGVGDDPTYYGETAVADWDEWLEYLCFSANAWVDELIAQANTVHVALETGAMSIGLLAAAIAAVALFVVGGFISIPVLLLLGVAGFAGISATVFEDIGDDLETAREDIVCAIMQGGDVAQAVEDALSSGAAWDLFYTLIDYDSAVAILYEGGDGDSIFLDPQKDATCDCAQIGEFSYYEDFETGTVGYYGNNSGFMDEFGGVGGGWSYREEYGEFFWIALSTGEFFDLPGTPSRSGVSKVIINRVRFSYRMTVDKQVRVQCVHDGGERNDYLDYSATYVEEEIVYDPPLVSTYQTQAAIRFLAPDGTTGYLHLDNITVDFDLLVDQ